MDKRSLVMNVQNRTIFERDNIEVLKGINSDSIDLIYLDPPFNSNKSYSAPIGSEAAGAAFKDSWTLDDVDNAWHGQIAEDYPSLYQCIVAAELAHGKAMKAYLIMMSIRMLEMHRILSPKGSIYLHCDPTASHYLKMMMDSVFGQDNFRNEIVWQRASGRAKGSQYKSKSLGKDTDNIFHYSKSNNLLHNLVTQPLSELEINEKFPYTDTNGRKYNTTTPLFRQPS
ncbi:site-specific DNA-methyltransferase, partial [Candidatus Poribacteria bacterium]|nr:site-specific DNA-methyltransferase [Candidatus Poribacteria bacterium]